MAKDRTKLGIFAAIGVYTLWGFTFMASKVAQGYVTPFILLAYRFDTAALVIAIPFIISRKKLDLKGKNIKPLLLLGFMEPCIYFIGEQYGLRFTNAAFSGVMIAVIPIVTLVFTAVFLKEKPTRAQWLFSTLSILGVIAITLSENSGGDISPIGVLCLVAAVLTGAIYGILSRSISDEFSVYERTLVMMLMAAVFFTALALIENASDPGAIIAPLKHGDFILAVLYLAIGASVLGYTLFNFAVSNAPMPKVIIFCNLVTVFSVLSGVFLLHEHFSAVSAVGLTAVLVGIWGVQKYDNEKSGSD